MDLGLKRIFADPRKVESGTSYNSKGTVPTPTSVGKEEGSSQPVRLPDVVPQFTSRTQMLRALREMENDPTADISLRAGKTPIMGATFYMQPFDSKPANVEIAEFCDFNIFEGTSRPFILVLADILRMFNDGWSVLEMVWETREWSARRTGANRKKYTMLKKFAPRPALTIKEITYDDNGGPEKIIQNAIQSDGSLKEVELDLEKLLIFTFNGEGGDLQGRPLLRTAYQPWYYKKELLKIDAIGHERNHLGVPGWTLPEGFTQDDVTAAYAWVTGIRTNERTGFIEPPGHTFRFEKMEGQSTNILPSIEHHDAAILLNIMAQFLLLGITGGGGRATSGAHVDMFQKAMRYMADYICGVFNLYTIPKLVGYNFDTTELPKMKVRNVGETKDFQMWASGHANLVTAGIITMDDETENWYRENADMPLFLGTRPEPEVVEEADTSNGNGSTKGSVQPQNRRSGSGNTNTPPGFESAGG
jgi:hypothetical protein